MTTEAASTLRGYVNASGFPLQIAVANAVASTVSRHGWKIRFQEHAWSHASSGESGFIDMVLLNQAETVVFTIECKRAKDANWIFLGDSTKTHDCKHAKCFVFQKNGPETKRFSWVDLNVEPTTYESSFCVVRGTDPNSSTLVERVGSHLVISTESLALEDKNLSLDDRWKLHIYFNLIVTTATLHICPLTASDVSLKNGTVGDVPFHEVPYLRFRKQLSTTYSVPEVFNTAGDSDVALAKENTVFVVNSMHLVDFLTHFDLENGFPNAHYLV